MHQLVTVLLILTATLCHVQSKAASFQWQKSSSDEEPFQYEPMIFLEGADHNDVDFKRGIRPRNYPFHFRRWSHLDGDEFVYRKKPRYGTLHSKLVENQMKKLFNIIDHRPRPSLVWNLGSYQTIPWFTEFSGKEGLAKLEELFRQ